MLKRAIHTLWNVLDELDQAWLPVEKSWKLNERHYGALQGLNKAETAEKYGDEQVKQWRRGFAVTPPELTKDDERYPGHDPRYAKLSEKELPLTESLALTIDRVIPYWNETILPRMKSGERVIIAAHGNSLRALVKYLDNMSEEEILELNIPTGVPLVYEFDENFNYPGHDPRYAKLSEKELPLTESLALTIDRVIPYWNETILPRMKSGERVIIAAHGNSLRALVKYLDNMSEEEILELNIPTGVPLVYEFDENFKPLKRYYLGNADEIAAKAAAVANQGKAK